MEQSRGIRRNSAPRPSRHDGAPRHRPRSLVASPYRPVDHRDRPRPSHRSLLIYPRWKVVGISRMVVGGYLLRTLEARRRECVDRIFIIRHDGGVPAFVLALPCTAPLGGGSDGSRRLGIRALLGDASPDIYFSVRQHLSLVAGTGRGQASAAALDSSSVSAMAEPACWLRTRSRAYVLLCCRLGPRSRQRNHALGEGSSHRHSHPPCDACVPGARAPQPQWHKTLSLPARHPTLIRDALAHCRVVFS